MTLSRPLLFLVIGIFLSAALARAEETQTVSVTILETGKMAVRVPAGWKATVIQPDPGVPPTMRILTGDQAISLQITFLPDREGKFSTKEGVERAVKAVTQRYVDGSVEKKLTLTPLEMKAGHGSYAAFTDAKLAGVKVPAKGQFRQVASGIAVVHKQSMIFTLLSNETTSAEYRRALQIVSEGISAE